MQRLLSKRRVSSSDSFFELFTRFRNSCLKERLTPLLDNCGFIGEENENHDYTHEYQWIVDPIDGTSNFIRDMRISVISVALVKNNNPILGVVYHPYQDEMFYAEKGKGAYVNGNPIRVSDRDLEHYTKQNFEYLKHVVSETVPQIPYYD